MLEKRDLHGFLLGKRTKSIDIVHTKLSLLKANITSKTIRIVMAELTNVHNLFGDQSRKQKVMQKDFVRIAGNIISALACVGFLNKMLFLV